MTDDVSLCDWCHTPTRDMREATDCPLCVKECPLFGVGPHEGPEYDEVKKMMEVV